MKRHKYYALKKVRRANPNPKCLYRIGNGFIEWFDDIRVKQWRASHLESFWSLTHSPTSRFKRISRDEARKCQPKAFKA
jgi:hypothetical protein